MQNTVFFSKIWPWSVSVWLLFFKFNRVSKVQVNFDWIHPICD